MTDKIVRLEDVLSLVDVPMWNISKVNGKDK
jgi:hypothetical protein